LLPLIWLSRGRGAWLTPRIASRAVALIGTYWLVECILVGQAAPPRRANQSSILALQELARLLQVWAASGAF
jgi:hypothetical protein